MVNIDRAALTVEQQAQVEAMRARTAEAIGPNLAFVLPRLGQPGSDGGARGRPGSAGYTITVRSADLDALLSILVAPDGRAILTHRPTRDRDEREARRRARDALLDLVAGRKLTEGERLDAIRRACGPLTGVPR